MEIDIGLIECLDCFEDVIVFFNRSWTFFRLLMNGWTLKMYIEWILDRLINYDFFMFLKLDENCTNSIGLNVEGVHRDIGLN